MSSSSDTALEILDDEEELINNNSKDIYQYPLHLAAARLDYSTLENFLEEGELGELRNDKGQTPLHCLLEDGFQAQLKEKDVIQCMELLLDFNIDVNVRDKRNVAAIDLAVQHLLVEPTAMLLEAGAMTTIKTATRIAHHMPEIMLDVFDAAVTYEEDSKKEEILVVLDWRAVLQYPNHELNETANFKNEQKETEFLNNILSTKSQHRKEYLSHPLVEAFLHFKYAKMYRYFLWFYIISVLYPLAYGIFIFFLYFQWCTLDEKPLETTTTPEPDSSEEDITITTIEDQTETTTPTTTTIAPTQGPRIGKDMIGTCEITNYIRAISAIFLVIIGSWALVEFYLQLRVKRKYLNSWRTWVIRITIVLMAVTLWPGLHYDNNINIHFQYPITSIAIFLAWTMFMIQMGLYQRFSIYLEILVKILLNVLRITLMFMPLFIGFFFGFNLLFTGMDNVFDFLMMAIDVGSVAYDTLVDDTKDDEGWFAGLAYLFCSMFIIIIVIVFMNFLLALSIKDVNELKDQAETANTARKIQNLFIADLVYPNSVLISKEDIKKGKYQFKYNPRQKPKPLPKNILLKITKLLKEKKYKLDEKRIHKQESMMVEKKHGAAITLASLSKLVLRRLNDIEARMKRRQVQVSHC